LPWAYRIPIPMALDVRMLLDPAVEFIEIEAAIYNLSRATAPSLSPRPFRVYRFTEATDRELSEAIKRAYFEANWMPA
jgi:hypothetical protein